MNNRHFWRKGEICRVMTMDEIKNELRTKETSLGLWTSDSKYGELILAFMPNEYENMGRVGEVIKAEYDYYATVEFVDGKRFEIPCMCLKVVKPTKCEIIEPEPIEIDDIVDLELNDFSDISDEFFVCNTNGIDLEEWVVADTDTVEHHKLCDAYAEVIKARVRVGEVLEELDKAIKVLEELLEE